MQGRQREVVSSVVFLVKAKEFNASALHESAPERSHLRDQSGGDSNDAEF